MNPNPATNETDAALDDLLQAHLASPSEQLTPSSGFTLSVMDAIHQQTSAPPPIAFPWLRVLPGAIAIVCALFAFAVFLRRSASAPAPKLSQLLASSTFTYTEAVVSLILLAICLSAIALAASFRLAGRDRWT
jgi:hypothetical protein